MSSGLSLNTSSQSSPLTDFSPIYLNPNWTLNRAWRFTHQSGHANDMSPDPMERVNWSACSQCYPALKKYPVEIKETEAILTFCALLLQLGTPRESNSLLHLQLCIQGNSTKFSRVAWDLYLGLNLVPFPHWNRTDINGTSSIQWLLWAWYKPDWTCYTYFNCLLLSVFRMLIWYPYQ